MYDILNTIYIGIPLLYLLGYIIAYAKLKHLYANSEFLQQSFPNELINRAIKWICWLSWLIVFIDFDKIIDGMTFDRIDDNYTDSIPLPNPEILPV